jgi:hypothetical protein
LRIAFTGTGSTGKTTLAEKLMQVSAFRAHVDMLISSISREIIDYFDLPGVDEMTPVQSQLFELLHFSRKLWREHSRDRFVTDRSFVDVAAIWVERDTRGMSSDLQELLTEPCRSLSGQYDFHCYFPRGVIPFVRDGVRSTNEEYHGRVDARIKSLLDAWNLPYITVTASAIADRISQVMDEIDRRASRSPLH